MDSRSWQQRRRDTALSSLNVAIETTNIANGALCMTPANAALGSVTVILTMIRDSMINEEDYVDLGLACAEVCKVLDRGMNGRRVDELSQPVFEAIGQLTTTVAEIQRKIVKRGKQRTLPRLFHAKADRDAITTWRLELNRILRIFNTELEINTNVVVSDVHRDVANAQTIVSGVHRGVSELQHSVVNTHTIISDIHRTIVEGRGSTDGGNRLTQISAPGESPPPPPRVCFGRDELTEQIVDLAEDLTPIALIGPGGIGKTSIALTVLHHYRIKEQFGDNRWFIRCDQFPASRAHFLNRLSKVIGAGVENPADLTPLRPFLSSRKMVLFLDNAESILDPQGANAQEIYTVVEELSQFKTICLCITSRIFTVPRYCKRLVIPTLSMESACDIFYAVYDCGGRSGIINYLLRQLDFHALSITLLATTASHNMWDHDRLAREWDTHRTRVLRADCSESLAATIELSLASPMFQNLGPDARDLLGVIAFFPQGVDENNVNRLFPDISNRTNILDKFCTLSLTHRNNRFITMLAPLRDYLTPKDPKSSPLLCTVKNCYFRQLSDDVNPDKPGCEEALWVMSEDVNIEHLLDVFTSVDANLVVVWDACASFMARLYWHKTRPVVLGPKIEGLPDDHPSKPGCLFELSRLFDSVGNFVESKRLLIHALELRRERGDRLEVARTMVFLAMTSWHLGLHKEGIPLAREALGIYEQSNHAVGQAQAWQRLARLLYCDSQLDAAEEAASRSIDLLQDEGQQFWLCQSHRILAEICHSKGKTEKAINNFETAIGIASSFDWHDQLSRSHYSLAALFFDEHRPDDAHAHAEHSKSHAISYPYLLGHAIHLQARFWYDQHKLEEAKSEALRAAEVYERIGATKDAEDCRGILRDVETKMEKSVTPGELDFNAPNAE